MIIDGQKWDGCEREKNIAKMEKVKVIQLLSDIFRLWKDFLGFAEGLKVMLNFPSARRGRKAFSGIKEFYLGLFMKMDVLMMSIDEFEDSWVNQNLLTELRDGSEGTKSL